MEWMVTNDGKYKIVSLSAATFSSALRVIRDVFCQEEAVSVGSEVNKNPEAIEELLELCADAALDGVSLVAVAVDTGDVVSVAFNKIQIKPFNAKEKSFFEKFYEERCKQPSSRSLIECVVNVEGRYNLFEKYGVDCSLEIMFLSTSQEHRNQKLATMLTETSINVARKIRNGPVAEISVEDLGFKYSHLKQRKPLNTHPKICYAIWTAKGSQKIGKALKFTVHVTVPLSEFIYNGKTYSERIGDGAAFCELATFPL